MAKIGNWGTTIKFQTSDDKILTFNGLKRTNSVRTSKHNIIGEKPKIELLGPELQSITFSIELNAMLGVRPRIVEKKLREKLYEGTVAPLVIGGKIICSKAMITNISSSYDTVLRKGEILSMSLDITMTEYN